MTAKEISAITIPAGPLRLHGDLAIPANAQGLVLFAHGSGSSRLSSRNRYVAGALQERGVATLLFDLLTPGEEQADHLTGHLRFNIDLLAGRLKQVTRWLVEEKPPGDLEMGYFGASTGAAAALMAAAELPDRVQAIVSRGGRPDLAGDALGRVQAATLLIVGGEDHAVIELNERAGQELRAEKELRIIPGATHLFEEPGALDQVARLAGDWFLKHFHGQPHKVL